MPRRNTPRDAFDLYVAPLRDAIRCVAHGTLLTSRERSYRADNVYSLVLNSADPVPLRSSPVIHLAAGQRFRIVHDDAIDGGPYHVQTVEYWYLISTADDRELLAYHWTPEAIGHGQKTYPHIHIGSALLADEPPVFPTTFHKKHLPSGHVSLESVVRFTIEELGVSPLTPDWSDVLDQGQAQFDRYRRR